MAARWAYSRWLAAAAVVLMVRLSPAQEAERNSLAGDAALEARSRQLASQPYTFKQGDFRVLLVPSMDFDWNDNINLSHDHALDDFILSPSVQVAVSYPLTQRNLLRFSVNVGYDQYLNHDQYSGVRLFSGSELSFDFYVKDFWFNVHDRFEYTQDDAGLAAVAGSGLYGGLDNKAGLSATWDLQDVLLNVGYDHENFIPSSSEFEYTERATEIVLARGGVRLTPQLIAGVEGTVGFTTYEQPVLNNNTGYSAGAYAEWTPGAYLQVKPRFGYTIYDFEQTSRFIRADDQNAWYVDLTVTHAVTEAVSYSLSGGHELRLGIQADSVEDWYVRPTVNWNLMKHVTLSTYFAYELGREGPFNPQGTAFEDYDWAGLGVGLSMALTERLTVALNYRLTLRSSNVEAREYTQNLVGLRLSYQLQ